MTGNRAMKVLRDHISRMEDESDQVINPHSVPQNDNWFADVRMDRDEHLKLFQQHPDFVRDNILWIVASIEVMSLIGLMWCCHADFWCALGAGFFISTGLFGLWAWEKVERAALEEKV